MKIIKRNYHIKNAVIQSIALHCIFIVVFIYISIDPPKIKNTMNNNKVTIDAIMVENHNIQKDFQQQKDTQLIKQQTESKDKKKQIIKNQQPLKDRIKEQPIVHKITKVKQNEKNSKERIKKDNFITTSKKQSNTQNKSQLLKINETKSIDKMNNINKKNILTYAKNSNEASNILDDLINFKNLSKSNNLVEHNKKMSPFNMVKNKQIEVNNNSEITIYKNSISKAISDKFYNASNYNGRICELHVKLDPDGKLTSINAIGGDKVLCQAAITAAKQAIIPKPPNSQVYEIFKSATIKFTPQ